MPLKLIQERHSAKLIAGVRLVAIAIVLGIEPRVATARRKCNQRSVILLKAVNDSTDPFNFFGLIASNIRAILAL